MDQNWNFYGNDYSFDISDADCLEKIGTVFTLARNFDEDEETLTPSEKSVKLCTAVRSFFSSLFGDEKSLVICGEKQSAARCAEAYLDFLAFLNKQIDEFSRIREAVEEKYSHRTALLAQAEQDDLQ